MQRWPQQLFQRFVLIVLFLPLCWLLMMVVHEGGHVCLSWLTGGTVRQVVLHPLAISRTDVAPNPFPLWVVWGGPALGVILPVMLWQLMQFLNAPAVYLWRFWAGFCLVANGAYLGLGSFDGIGDAGDLLRLGCPMWGLWLFGIVTIPAGFLLWHKQGEHFGWGQSPQRVEWSVICAVLTLLILVVTLEISISKTM